MTKHLQIRMEPDFERFEKAAKSRGYRSTQSVGLAAIEAWMTPNPDSPFPDATQEEIAALRCLLRCMRRKT
jgi:hypothetical protein